MAEPETPKAATPEAGPPEAGSPEAGSPEAASPGAAIPESPPDPPAWLARKLLRAARAGTLATVVHGQPFASLVTPATAPDLAVLLLLSTLSEHTRHLRSDPRCSLLAVGSPQSANPQTAPRVTLTGLAEPAPDPALRARFLAVHPYAALYADFADFALWRIQPVAALFVGGFASASRLRAADLAPDPAAVAVIAAAAADIMSHCNADHADAMAAIAGTPGAWRLVAVDVDGCDLAQSEQVVRVAWPAPVASPGDVRQALIRLARAARAA